MQNILVTGGAGYIGSHACKALKKDGFIPVTLDNLSTGWEDSVKFGPFEKVDLLNKSDINRVFKKYSPIAVMHFAALSQVEESMKHPYLYWENNVLGSLNLIKTAVDNKCMNFVFSSTSAIYGGYENKSLNEDSLKNPNNTYGSTKLAVENILMNFENSYGIKHIIFRYFNVAGADQYCEVGEFHQPETHLIPRIFNIIDSKLSNLTINGTDYDTPDGTCIRDYIHVEDLIDAHILGLKWLLSDKKSNIFNLGTGVGFSVKEIISQVEKITKNKIPTTIGKRRCGDHPKLVCNSNYAINELGWNIKRSNLQQIIEDAFRWHKYGYYSK